MRSNIDCVMFTIDVSRVMPVALGARSLWTRMEDGGATEEEHFQEKTLLKLIARLATLLAGWPSQWWLPSWLGECSSRFTFFFFLNVYIYILIFFVLA